MSNDRRRRAPTDDPPYRVYRAGGHEESAREEERPYTLYRSLPKGLRARLRGDEPGQESIAERERRDGLGRGGRGYSGGGRGGDGGRRGLPGFRRGGDRGFFSRPGRRITVGRVLKWIVLVVIGWLLLSLVAFLVSATIQSGSIPASAKRQLSSGSNMITGTDTVLVLGTDQRPKGSREPGADTSDKGSRSDTIMLWRIGGGVSRRLSIPRDTVAAIPGYGETKINAAYAYGGPALAIKTISQFTGLQINHVIVVNLANFPRFINAIGGVDVKTGRICSEISGGVQNGGFTLNLAPGDHHLNGSQALTLARTRENSCNAASNDLTREGYQQQILNSIKSRLTSPAIFPRLPFAAWDAPTAVRTDMGGPTLLSLFLASEIGGSAPTDILKPTGAEVLSDGEDALVASPAVLRSHVDKLLGR